MIILQVVVDTLDPADKAVFAALEQPVAEVENAIYGLGRSGPDFIYTFIAWLSINLWYTVPEEPALQVYWVTEEPSVILKRAMSNKQYVDAEMRRGRNVLLDRPAPTQLRGDVEKSNLEKLKRIAGTEQKAVVMATYVDDCDMDGKKEYKSLMWAVVRVYFESADPEDVKKFLGIIHEVCIENRTCTWRR
jgi:hypothetical protein